MMNAERFSTLLLAELYALEEDGYRLALHEAERMGSAPPAAALRALAGHATTVLDELPALAQHRGLQIRSLQALVLDSVRRVRDRLVGRLIDDTQGYRRALAAQRREADLVRLTCAAARHDGDLALAAWCRRWMRGRERLLADATDGLEWLAAHASRRESHQRRGSRRERQRDRTALIA